MNRRARRAKLHSQKPSRVNLTCKPCSIGECEECVDVYRSVYATSGICTCEKRSHITDVKASVTKKELTRLTEGTEPHTQQILDPVDGTVYAPGLKVSFDGEVTFFDEEK